ncbi:hypothetical protein GQ55_1G160900 [Panicum hallii var. hallii]|uniref:CASP-like protein n=1 Tax=Panicum hallii var. hallii TaxID=1504633 RepID=A0A2T7F5P8_9POAL|nr:hypothetical protein GQ55_1G160900 [Panicum hallii var. hallii]
MACRLVLLPCFHSSAASPCLDVGFTGAWVPLLLSGFVALLFQLAAAAAFVLFRFIYLDISSMDHWCVRACMHGKCP